MMKLITKVTAAAFILSLLMSLGALAAFAGNQKVCPEEGKVESIVDGDLDNIVLEEGTLVCIKGGQTLVELVADGSSTLATLLGTGQNVSHYTVLSPPATTTTTSTSTTTTTLPGTTTTIPETTTTTTGPSTSTTVAQETVTTTCPIEDRSARGDCPNETPIGDTPVNDQSPDEVVEKEAKAILPFTGTENIPFVVALALTMLACGGYLLRKESKTWNEQ